VRGALTVVAVADHPDFRKWQLDMLVWGDAAQAHFLGVGEDAQPNPIALQTIDSTLFPDGEHLLRLRVVREDQNYDEYLTPIVIANQAPVARAASGLGAMSALSRVGQLVVLPAAAPTLPAAAPTVTETATAAPGRSSALVQAAVPVRPAGAPAVAPSGGRKWIEVSISNQTLTAWEGNRPFLQTSVSTGKTGWRTLPGTFSIYLKYEKTRMVGEEYDTPDVPWTMYYSGDFAVHGAYWHNDFGTPVSHGCVNMPVDEAKVLYEWAPLGTEVVVRP
jgi:lipoprotein-anchoring transpeptidase ErfK/SrfK